MTITVEIAPETEAKLTARAQALGLDVPTYAASLIEEAVRPPQSVTRKHSVKDLEQTLAEMAQFSGKIPALPDEAFKRESIYRDHD